LYVKLIASFIVIFLSQGSNASTKFAQSSALEEVFENTRVIPTKKERRLANNFKQLYKLSRKGIINNALVKKFYKDVLKSKTFVPYREWPRNLIKLSKTKKITDIKRLCTKLANFKTEDFVKQDLNNNVKNLCFNKFIKAVSANQRESYKFHKEQARYLSFNTKHILIPSNYTDINFLLSRFKKGSSKHKLYSKKIMNHYQATKSTPPNELLKYAYVTPSNTRYLQTLDLEKYNTQYVFYKEFKKLKEIAFKTLDEKKSKEEITKTFNQALNYFNLTYTHLPKEKALLSLLSISKSLMRRNFHSLAQKGFKRILQQKTYHYDTTLFENMWSHVSQNEYVEALKSIEIVANDKKFLSKHSKIHFWIGFLNQKTGNKDFAQETFKVVIGNNPLSYYSILSAKMIGDDNKRSTQEIYLANIPKNNDTTISKVGVDYKWLKRVTLWGVVYHPKFIKLELKNLRRSKSVKMIEEHILSAAYNLSNNGEYLESFKILYKSIKNDSIKLTKNTLKILFPKPYLKQIKKNTHSFDPIIALSLIRQESGFNTRAQSHVGARGLMQLMPGTARQFKRRLKNKHLYNPNLNIKIGTTYFNNLMTRYNKNLVYSLAAYNAGERRVNEWQDDYMNSDFMLENIENIPFLETRKYVKLIFRNIFFYKMILSKNKNDTQDLNKIYDIHLGFES
jgi:soluble lytic murein transglycosylase